MSHWFRYFLWSLHSSISGHLWALDICVGEWCNTRILWLPQDDLLCGWLKGFVSNLWFSSSLYNIFFYLLMRVLFTILFNWSNVTFLLFYSLYLNPKKIWKILKPGWRSCKISNACFGPCALCSLGEFCLRQLSDCVFLSIYMHCNVNTGTEAVMNLVTSNQIGYSLRKDACHMNSTSNKFCK